jgi:hypothetical protein
VKLDSYQRGRAHPLHEKPEKPRKMPRRIGDANDGPDSLRDFGTWVWVVLLIAGGIAAVWYFWKQFGSPE